MLIGGVPIFIGAPLLETVPDLGQVSTPALLAALYTAAIPIIFCQAAYFKIVRLFPATVAAISTLAIPVIGVFASALMLDEAIGWRHAMALGLVVAGTALVLLVPARRRQPAS